MTQVALWLSEGRDDPGDRKESDKAGKPVYEVEYTKDGVERELKVSQSGAVIARHKD